MFSKTTTKISTQDYSDKIKLLKEKLDEVDTVLVGAGAGLSTSAGHLYSGERFEKNFPDFKAKYSITDMYSGGFYNFPTLEEFWAWWSRQIFLNRYNREKNLVFQNLLSLINKKNYFVITTNADHLFQDNDFDKNRLFYTQGDYGLFQCSKACHHQTYDNKEIIYEMYSQQKDMKIPSHLIPYCPKCNAPMTPNLRKDDTFIQDSGWDKAYKNYEYFLKQNMDSKILLLEFGIGGNTPVIIKYPFWDFTMKNKNATYACINIDFCTCPAPLKDRAILIQADIKQTLEDLL